MTSFDEQRARFRRLHEEGFFVMPNPWDVGSAVRLERLGFPALATTSLGFAWALGKDDHEVTFDELVAHVAALTAVIGVPLNVDSERLFADGVDGIAGSVAALAEAGASGVSIEDWNPATGEIDAVDVAAARVEAAAAACRQHHIVLTGRAENHFHGVDDLDDTIARLVAYREAGADVLYAPGLVRADDIRRVISEVDRPINVLNMPAGPGIAELAGLGVRRVSTGSALARLAYRTMEDAATSLL